MAKTLSLRQQKQRNNKNKLIDDLAQDIMNDSYAWQDFTYDLIREALQKRTQKELKHLLYGT